MKIALDEHVPPALVSVFKSFVRDGYFENCEVCSARDYSSGVGELTDVPWIQRFMADRGEVVISGDKEMRSLPEVQAAIRESGAKVYYLPSKWNHWDMAKRVGFILVWWDTIIEHASGSAPGDSWILPPNWVNKSFKKVSDGGEEGPEHE